MESLSAKQVKVLASVTNHTLQEISKNTLDIPLKKAILFYTNNSFFVTLTQKLEALYA